jgi:hypothetical protein
MTSKYSKILENGSSSFVDRVDQQAEEDTALVYDSETKYRRKSEINSVNAGLVGYKTSDDAAPVCAAPVFLAQGGALASSDAGGEGGSTPAANNVATNQTVWTSSSAKDNALGAVGVTKWTQQVTKTKKNSRKKYIGA